MVCTLTRGGKAACNSSKFCIDFFFPSIRGAILARKIHGALPPPLSSFQTACWLTQKKSKKQPKSFLKVAFSHFTTKLQSSFSCECFSQSFW